MSDEKQKLLELKAAFADCVFEIGQLEMRAKTVQQNADGIRKQIMEIQKGESKCG